MHLSGVAYVKQPVACTDHERQEYARLVREGFKGSDEGLHGRIRAAKYLAFYYVAGDTLVAIAGLKAPSAGYRQDVFEKAEAGVSPNDYTLELGWVFVAPDHRRQRIAGNLCGRLLDLVPGSCVFATSRTDNIFMHRILLALGFARFGNPYSRRDEELVLFLRS